MFFLRIIEDNDIVNIEDGVLPFHRSWYDVHRTLKRC